MYYNLRKVQIDIDDLFGLCFAATPVTLELFCPATGSCASPATGPRGWRNPGGDRDRWTDEVTGPQTNGGSTIPLATKSMAQELPCSSLWRWHHSRKTWICCQVNTPPPPPKTKKKCKSLDSLSWCVCYVLSLLWGIILFTSFVAFWIRFMFCQVLRPWRNSWRIPAPI